MTWTIALVVLVVALLVAGLVDWWTHRPKCIRGHYETKTIAAHTRIDLIHIGNSLVPVPIPIPEHDEQVWVCDEYEPANKDSAK